jgi:hypothetical protein
MGYTGYSTLVGSIAIAWGVSVTKQKSLEIRLGVVESEHKTDHDLLIEIKTKLDILLSSVTRQLS